MPLSQSDYTTLILLEVGDTSSGAIADNIDLLWTKWDSIDTLDLQALFVRRDAIDIAIADVRTRVDYAAMDGSSIKDSDLMKHLLQMREQVDAQIAQFQAGLGGGGTVAQLTTTAPIMRDNANQADPNDRRYRGDPLRSRGTGWP